MVFENRLFLFSGKEETPLYELVTTAFRGKYQVKQMKTLADLDELLMGSVHGAMILFDWDHVDAPYKMLVSLRESYYVWPVLVVGTDIGHQMTINLLREQVNDVLEWPVSVEDMTSSVSKIVAEFPDRSVLNTLFYVTRTHKGFSHMEDRIQQLESHVRAPFGRVSHADYEPELANHLSFFTPKKYKVLVVDDRPVLLQSFKQLFKEKYEVLTANSSDAALAIVEYDLDIDLIILDIEMPGRKGNEIIVELRQLLPNCAILIQTAYKAVDVAIESFQKGALDYINKSESAAKIAEKIESLLTMKEQWDAGRDLPLRVRQTFFLQFLKHSLDYKQPVLWRDVKMYFPEYSYQKYDLATRVDFLELQKFLG
jgi:DNA-binding NtrC family response regulator